MFWIYVEVVFGCLWIIIRFSCFIFIFVLNIDVVNIVLGLFGIKGLFEKFEFISFSKVGSFVEFV